MTMSDRVAIMNDGRLQQLETPDRVYSHPNNVWVAGFIGSPAMNFFDCTFRSRDGGGVLDAGEFSIELGSEVAGLVRKNASGPEVILGVRPEDISVAKKREPGSIEGSVYVVEPIGDSAIVDANVGKNLVKARADASFVAEIEEKIYLTFNQDKIHIFDKRQQTAIV
jgi:multiple sugar transport system ATP-binding protein